MEGERVEQRNQEVEVEVDQALPPADLPHALELAVEWEGLEEERPIVPVLVVRQAVLEMVGAEAAIAMA